MIRKLRYSTLAIFAPKKRQTSVLANEEGSVIIIALIILMMLTVVGTSATNTSTLEIQVAGNERNYKRNFFRTEAATMQGAQRVENSNTFDQGIGEGWLQMTGFQYDETSFEPDNPEGSTDSFSNVNNWVNLELTEGTAYADTRALVVYTGVAAGASLDMTATSQLRAYAVYGQLYDTNKSARMIIETGYGKRF